MKYCHPKLASAGVITSDVDRRQQAFLAPLLGRHIVKYIDKVVNKIKIGICLLNRLTWLCFLVFVDMKIG